MLKPLFRIIWDADNGFVLPENKVAPFVAALVNSNDASTNPADLVPLSDPMFTPLLQASQRGSLFTQDGTRILVVGSELIVNEFRLAVARGKLKSTDLTIYITEDRVEVVVDHIGRPDRTLFIGAVGSNQARELLDYMMKEMDRERAASPTKLG